MTVSTTEQHRLDDDGNNVVAAVNEVEADIREFVRRDTRQLRRTAETTGEAFATNVNSLVQRVAGTSLREIDLLLRELEGLREFLHSEGERVQREVSSYAHLSQTAMNSTKIIAESMHQWRKLTQTGRGN